MKLKKILSIATAVVLMLSMLQVSALAETDTVYIDEEAAIINPCDYITGTQWNDNETYISVSNNLTTAQEYVVSVPLEVAADGEYQLEFESASKIDNGALSPIKFRIDDTDKINTDDNSTVKGSTGNKTVLGVGTSWKKYNGKISLSQGSHTISFIVDEMRIKGGVKKGYQAALGTIKLLPDEGDGTGIKADRENVLKPNDYIGDGGWVRGDDYAKVESGDTEAKVYTLDIPIILSEAAIFSMSVEACLNPSDAAYHFSRIKFSLDDGELITINDTNSPVVKKTDKESWGAQLELRKYNDYLVLEKGLHKLTFVVDDLRAVGGEFAGQYAALGDINLSPLFALEKVGANVSIGLGSGWTYSSDDNDIAVVSPEGDVTIKRSGKAIVTVTDEAGNIYKVPVYGTRNAGIYIENTYILGKRAYFDVKKVGEDLTYKVIAGKRKKSTDGVLYGFLEVKTGNNYVEFTSINEDEEIVIFAVDDENNYLYGKTIITSR